MSAKTAELKNIHIFGYGLGHVFNDVCASMWFTYLLIFFQKVLKFSSTNAGLLLLVGQLADGISTTGVGLLSDRLSGLWFCRFYGKRKSVHLLGTICVAISFPFVFLPCLGCSDSGEQLQMVYYCCMIVVFQFGWASTQISHLALITDMTACEHKRTTLTAVRYGFTVISSIGVYLVAWVFLGVNNNGMLCLDDQVKFRNIMLVCISIGMASSLGFHILVREDKTQESESNESEIGELGTEATKKGELSTGTSPQPVSIISWFGKPLFYAVAVIYTCTRLFVNLSQAYIPFYLQDNLSANSSFLAIIPLVMFCSSFVSSFFTKPANKYLGRPLTWLCGAAFGCVAALLVNFLADSCYFLETYGIFIIAVLYGAASSVLLITSLGLTADLIGDQVGSAAFIYGIMSLLDKVANGVVVVIIQSQIPCMKLYGYDAPTTTLAPSPDLSPDCTTSSPMDSTHTPCILPTPKSTSTCLTFYQYVLSLATGGSVVLGALAVLIVMVVRLRRRLREKNQYKK